MVEADQVLGTGNQLPTSFRKSRSAKILGPKASIYEGTHLGCVHGTHFLRLASPNRPRVLRVQSKKVIYKIGVILFCKKAYHHYEQ